MRPVSEPAFEDVYDEATLRRLGRGDLPEPLPRPQVGPVRRTAVGTVVAASLLGLADVLEERRQDPVVEVVPAPDPEDEPRVALEFDPEDSRATVARVRP